MVIEDELFITYLEVAQYNIRMAQGSVTMFSGIEGNSKQLQGLSKPTYPCNSHKDRHREGRDRKNQITVYSGNWNKKDNMLILLAAYEFK